MQNPSNAEIVYGGKGFVSDLGIVNESYMWDVSSDFQQEGQLYAVLIDVDSGEVLGKATFGRNARTVIPTDNIPAKTTVHDAISKVDKMTNSNSPQYNSAKNIWSNSKKPIIYFSLFGLGAILVVSIGYYFFRRKIKK